MLPSQIRTFQLIKKAYRGLRSVVAATKKGCSRAHATTLRGFMCGVGRAGGIIYEEEVMRIHHFKAIPVARRPAWHLDRNAEVALLVALLGLAVTLAVGRVGWNGGSPEAARITAVAAHSPAEKGLALS